MDDFDESVRKIKAELTKRGMQHSSLVYNRLAEHYRPYYKSSSQPEKEKLLMRLRRFEKENASTNPFEWEDALK